MPDTNQPHDPFTASLNGGAPLHPGVGPEPVTTLPAPAPGPAPAPNYPQPPQYAPPPQPAYAAPGYPPPPGYPPYPGYAAPPGYAPQPVYAQPAPPREKRRSGAPSLSTWAIAFTATVYLLAMIFKPLEAVFGWSAMISTGIAYGLIARWLSGRIGYLAGMFVGAYESGVTSARFDEEWKKRH